MNFKSRELLFVLVIGRMRLAFARGIDAARICQISSKGHAENPLYSFFILARNEQREAAENFFSIIEKKLTGKKNHAQFQNNDIVRSCVERNLKPDILQIF